MIEIKLEAVTAYSVCKIVESAVSRIPFSTRTGSDGRADKAEEKAEDAEHETCDSKTVLAALQGNDSENDTYCCKSGKDPAENGTACRTGIVLHSTKRTSTSRPAENDGYDTDNERNDTESAALLLGGHLRLLVVGLLIGLLGSLLILGLLILRLLRLLIILLLRLLRLLRLLEVIVLIHNYISFG